MFVGILSYHLVRKHMYGVDAQFHVTNPFDARINEVVTAREEDEYK